MDILEKLTILTDAAKYDVACTSSGSSRRNNGSGIGSAVSAGICHSFSADGRCISLLKILMTNVCIYDCQYCVNRRTNDSVRAAFTPEEVAELTINFYKRNYIEGLFLSSGIVKNPDYTTEQLIAALSLLRTKYNFQGYIHVKAIPGADPVLLARLGMLADRMSVNIELPSSQSLALLAPDKSKVSILKPMGLIRDGISQSRELVKYTKQPKFVPAGQSTQMIVGASGESDKQIISLTQGLYDKYALRRVFFSAYVPVGTNPLLPTVDTKPPLLREHRLYQADWLLRFYKFKAEEILDDANPNLNPYLDPKANWALNNPQFFPVEIETASLNVLLRVPGIGPKNAQRITASRKNGALTYEALKKMGVVLKTARFFITIKGSRLDGITLTTAGIMQHLISKQSLKLLHDSSFKQMSLFTNDQQDSLVQLTSAI